jgi:CheY-like chemotaxis protein
MSQSNKRSGIGFEAEDELRSPPTGCPLPLILSTSLNPPSQQQPALEKNSTDFLEAQNLYAKIRFEIEASFHGEREAAFKKSMTARMKAEIRRGMVLDVQEENRKCC